MNRVIPSAGGPIFKVTAFDNDQVPGGYLKSVKISVCPDSLVASNVSFMIVASTSSIPANTGDWITAQAVGQGGGTVWLSLKRSIKDGVEDESRNDGPVFFHCITQGTATQADFVLESWGRFLSAVAL